MVRQSRYESYKDWIDDSERKDNLKKWLEKAGVPLELRTITALEKHGYRCSSFHYKDRETEKYRELDIYATKTNVKKFSIGKCQVEIGVLILAECKYSHYNDFLAFEREDKFYPSFPLIFRGRGLFGSHHKDFTFPMIIRKMAETNVKDFESNSQTTVSDKVTHDACEQLIAGLSQVYDRKRKSDKIAYDRLRWKFEQSWNRIIGNTKPKDRWGLRQFIGTFLKDFKTKDLLEEIPYFPVEIGFPIFVIPQERGLIKTKHDTATGQITDFEDVGYGIYPYVSENSDNYNNILSNYFEFPIVVCNLGYLDDCLKTLYEGIDKMATYAQQLLQNNPKAIAAEVFELIFE